MNVHDPISLEEAIKEWESVLDGQSRLSEKHFRSLYHWGNTIFCEENESLSSVFIHSHLCDSKSDFKRSMSGLYVNEQKLIMDGLIKDFCLPSTNIVLLRKGKHTARLAVVPPKT